jgi:hypothetical protein
VVRWRKSEGGRVRSGRGRRGRYGRSGLARERNCEEDGLLAKGRYLSTIFVLAMECESSIGASAKGINQQVILINPVGIVGIVMRS